MKSDGIVESSNRKTKTESKLEDGVKKGQLQVAPSKNDRQKESNVFGQVASNAGKKGKKQRDGAAGEEEELKLDYDLI